MFKSGSQTSGQSVTRPLSELLTDGRSEGHCDTVALFAAHGCTRDSLTTV